LVSNRLNTPVRSLLPPSLAVASEPVMVANSSQRGEEGGGPVVLGFPIDFVADRMVRCKRLSGIDVDGGCEATSGCANLERFVGDAGGGGGGGGAREGLEEEAMDGVE
jgi:hypothetical protein